MIKDDENGMEVQESEEERLAQSNLDIEERLVNSCLVIRVSKNIKITINQG